jgi:hypothetical protein
MNPATPPLLSTVTAKTMAANRSSVTSIRWRPGGRGDRIALVPWLCVTVFRRVCSEQRVLEGSGHTVADPHDQPQYSRADMRATVMQVTKAAGRTMGLLRDPFGTTTFRKTRGDGLDCIRLGCSNAAPVLASRRTIGPAGSLEQGCKYLGHMAVVLKCPRHSLCTGSRD